MDDKRRASELAALRPRLLRRARRYTNDATEAEDLIQEAIVRVWIRLRADPPITDLYSYVVSAMRRLAMRRPPADAELTEADAPQVPAEAPRRIAAAEVMMAVHELPEDQAELLIGYAVEGNSYTTLAEQHGVPVGTVMSRVARGRARLKARLNLPAKAPVEALLDRAG